MCDGRKGESWGLVWIILVGNTCKLVFYFNFFLNLGEQRLLHSSVLFLHFQYGLYVKQLDFLVSIHYIKASNVFSNWGEKLGQWGISQVYFCFWKPSKEISQPSQEPLN